MIQASNITSDTAEMRFAEELFGADFEVWSFDNRWHRIRHGVRVAETSVDYYVRLISFLSDAARKSGLQLYRFDSCQTVCLLPVLRGSRPCVALQLLDTQSDDAMALVQRAASAALSQQRRAETIKDQLRSSDSQLAAWTNRISQGTAELAWLHGLSRNVELSGTADSSRHVAERILPELCRLIRARTVAFVACPDNDSEECLEEECAQEFSIWQTGEMTIPQSVCEMLIATAESDAGEPARLLSYSVPTYARPGFSGVLSSVVKVVTTGTMRIGWLIAVNKDLQYLTRIDDPGRPDLVTQSECEFGTFESGLIEAAANAFSAHARNSSLLREKEKLVDGAIRSLVNAIDAKDSYTFGHSDRVAEYAREIAATMGMDAQFCDQIYMTGLLHDVGKIGVPDSVLQKPGRLTAEEFEKIKAHPVIGHEILRHLADFDYVLPGVLHHHESVDGTGYPHGLVGGEIPLTARILAVADAYDAMTSDRPYRDGMPSEKAASIIIDGAGQQWDEDCVEAFQKCIQGIRLIGHQRHVEFASKTHLQRT